MHRGTAVAYWTGRALKGSAALGAAHSKYRRPSMKAFERYAFGLLIASICVVSMSTPAHAWLRFCNKTNQLVYISTTKPDASCQICSGGACTGSPWRRQGWYYPSAGTCATVYTSSAKNKKFYYYARSFDWSMVWTSSQFQWENPWDGHNYCAWSALFDEDEVLMSGHREISPTSTDWTVNLVP
jgi:uncharacterized membrane protein